MNEKLTPSSLDQFGLTRYEARSYLSLLEKNKLTGAEVARLAEVPRSRIYDTLEQLELKGLCQRMPGKVKMYSAVDPSRLKEVLIKLEKDKAAIKIEKLKIEIQKEKEQLDDKVKEAEIIVDKLIPVFQESRMADDPLDYIEVLRNSNQVHYKFIELYSKAQKEVLLFSRSPFSYASEEQMNEQIKVQEEADLRGVVSRNITVVPNDVSPEEFLAKVKNTTTPKQDGSRFIEALPIKLAIFDDKACIFSLEDPVQKKTSITSLVTEHMAMAISFKFLFESFWEKAKDYFEVNGKRYYP